MQPYVSQPNWLKGTAVIESNWNVPVNTTSLHPKWPGINTSSLKSPWKPSSNGCQESSDEWILFLLKSNEIVKWSKGGFYTVPIIVLKKQRGVSSDQQVIETFKRTTPFDLTGIEYKISEDGVSIDRTIADEFVRGNKQ